MKRTARGLALLHLATWPVTVQEAEYPSALAATAGDKPLLPPKNVPSPRKLNKAFR